MNGGLAILPRPLLPPNTAESGGEANPTSPTSLALVRRSNSETEFECVKDRWLLKLLSCECDELVGWDDEPEAVKVW